MEGIVKEIEGEGEAIARKARSPRLYAPHDDRQAQISSVISQSIMI
jgi:hypothetical protein